MADVVLSELARAVRLRLRPVRGTCLAGIRGDVALISINLPDRDPPLSSSTPAQRSTRILAPFIRGKGISPAGCGTSRRARPG